MKSIVFDTGPIITLAMNNLLDVFPKLKDSFKGEFYITPAIKNEVIDRPLDSKKFKFEALQVLHQMQSGVFKLYQSNLDKKTEELLFIANNSFKAQGNYIQIVHYAEMEVIAAALELNADAIVVDERTTRLLVENPFLIKERLEKKLHTNVEINRENISQLKTILSGIKVLRSVELITVAYEKGFLDNFVPRDLKEPRKELLTAVLWGVKLAGCSVSEDEIDSLLRIENTS